MNQKRDCKGLSVIEIGCGRGGGLNYITNHLLPKQVIGVDISGSQINFCKNLYSENDKLSFV